jgi:TonB family protein
MRDKKILVVDFDEESLIALSNLVFEEGFQAVTAMDGLSGYEKFKAEDFDLVMIEPMLPKLHGFELMKRINEDPARKVPIMVVTGIYREPSCKMEALQVYGAAAYFTKPWNKDELRSKMLNLLVNGMEEKVAKPEPPPIKVESAPPPPKISPPPVAQDWGHLKSQAAPPREPKVSKGLADIEKELQAAVSGLTGPARKKEPVKDVFREKKEARAGVDGDIEAMLKGAIGGLGLDEKKKKPEPVVRPAPVFKPEPKLEKFEKLEKKEKITVAKEIKERIPLHDRAGNSIPRPSAQAPIYAERTPFGIDKTLLEIDKIPLEQEKSAPMPMKFAREPGKAAPEEKKVFFDEYVEPAKKKPPVALIGGVAAAALIVAVSTFVVIKSKKPKEPAPQMVSSLQPSLPSEFALRQNEIQSSSESSQSESKPEPKRPLPKPVEQTETSEVVNQIQPALPYENQPVGLEIQLPSNSEQTATLVGQPETSTTENLAPGEAPDQAESRPEKPPADAPVEAKPEPGDLLPLDKVTIAPALIKRLDPKYPLQAFTMGISGVVTVNVLISETGDVLRTEILKGIKGNYGFERAAETAIRQWKFRPAEKDGVPVRVWKAIDITFKMSQTPNR